HCHRLGNAARDRGLMHLLDQALRRYLGFDVGRILDDHMRHGFLPKASRRTPVALTPVANFLMFWAGQASASSDADPGSEHVKIATFSAGGRTSYGVVVGDGIV